MLRVLPCRCWTRLSPGRCRRRTNERWLSLARILHERRDSRARRMGTARVRFVKLSFRIAFSIACIALLLSYVVDVRDLGRVFRDIDLRYLLLAAAIITADRALMTYKWI